MKRSILVFAVAVLILVTVGIWYFSYPNLSGSIEFVHLGVILLLVVFAVFVGFKRLTSEKRGEPTEDELTKRILQRTAAVSYYISLYLWVLVLIVKDRVSMDVEVLIGTGILGMAVTFAVCWLYFNYRGVRNE